MKEGNISKVSRIYLGHIWLGHSSYILVIFLKIMIVFSFSDLLVFINSINI